MIARVLASCIVDELKHQKMNETHQNLIAQTYDGASVIAGTSISVHAIVQNSYSDAQYVHCQTHQLNLVAMRATSTTLNR